MAGPTSSKSKKAAATSTTAVAAVAPNASKASDPPSAAELKRAIPKKSAAKGPTRSAKSSAATRAAATRAAAASTAAKPSAAASTAAASTAATRAAATRAAATPSAAKPTRTQRPVATASAAKPVAATPHAVPVPRAAAIFDLDRTLLSGGSGPVFGDVLARLGVRTPKVPGQELLFGLYDRFGESWAVMQLARQAVRRTAGLQRDAVLEGAEAAADILVGKVQPFVRPVIEAHRAAGDLLVLATTSPHDLVAPFAQRLGFDHVVATKYRDIDGRYTGEIDGEFVWGPGKLRAVAAWAEAENVDLDLSTAYSDSVFDVPLLAAVGQPVAVNPDLRLRGLAAVLGWEQRWFDAPKGVPRFGGIQPYDVLRTIIRPEFFLGVRFEISGTENIPSEGPAIIVANHRSYFDPLTVSFAVAKAGRNARFLSKKEVLDAPVVGAAAKAMGAIRVDRGSGSDGPLIAAAAALDGGEVVVFFPQGTIPRGRDFFETELNGRPGAARLAAMRPDVPVIPLGLWGTEAVWPRASKMPNLTRLADRPSVQAVVGAPVGLRYDDVTADTDLMMRAVQALLPPEANEVREPTDSEIANATPSGAKAGNERPGPRPRRVRPSGDKRRSQRG